MFGHRYRLKLYENMMLKLLVCLLVVLNVLPVTVARTRFGQPFSEECPSTQSIYWIKSVHDNYHEDRAWDFLCRPSDKISTVCQWYNKVNSFESTFHFQCPRKGAIVGVQSYESNHYEDRVWSFKCCDVQHTNGESPENCVLSEFVNRWDAAMDYKLTPTNQYLTGAYSIHDNYHEDRRWKYETCTIVE